MKVGNHKERKGATADLEDEIRARKMARRFAIRASSVDWDQMDQIASDLSSLTKP